MMGPSIHSHEADVPEAINYSSGAFGRDGFFIPGLKPRATDVQSLRDWWLTSLILARLLIQRVY